MSTALHIHAVMKQLLAWEPSRSSQNNAATEFLEGHHIQRG